MERKILVTPRSVTRHGHPSLDTLRAAGWEVVFCRPGVQPDEDELRSLLPGCAGYLAGVEPVTARALEPATALRVISRNGTGVDNIDLTAAASRGIVVLRAEGANARGVAELVIGQLFALARGLTTCDAALKAGGWSRPTAGVEVEGKTLGLIGCGRVGQLVARLGLGLGMTVCAYDPTPPASFAPGPGFRLASFDDVLATADFLSLHCPPAPGGRPLIDAPALVRMKAGACLLNTARHDLIDPAAVLAALDGGHLAGMAIDVFDTEPPTDHRLAAHPRVLATPHIGGFTKESIDRAMAVAVANLRHALDSPRPHP
jgi:phosphoglycerate dehydrogenase-like enzyme